MDDIDQRLARIAAPTAGAFTIQAARREGIAPSAIHRRVRRGAIQRIHPGVYFAGVVVTLAAYRWAAVLAGPPGTLLAGAAAETEWGIGRWASTAVTIVVPRRQRPLEGVTVIQSATLHAEDAALHAGRPLTTVERTLVDVAGARPVGHLCRALREAQFRSILDIPRLVRTMDRNANRRGVGRVRRALELHVRGHGGTDSSVEDRFVSKLGRAGVPGAACNVAFVIGGAELRVDVWIEHLELVVEIDPDWHEGEAVRREDSLRGALCRSDGKRHLRVPGDALDRGVEQVLAMHHAWLPSQRS